MISIMRLWGTKWRVNKYVLTLVLFLYNPKQILYIFIEIMITYLQK